MLACIVLPATAKSTRKQSLAWRLIFISSGRHLTHVKIDSEVRECQFFSIKVDETTDISAKAQLSANCAIIRLDSGSQVVERVTKAGG